MYSCSNWLSPQASAAPKLSRFLSQPHLESVSLSRLRSCAYGCSLEWLHISNFIGYCQIVLQKSYAISPSQPIVGKNSHSHRSSSTLRNIGLSQLGTSDLFFFIPHLSVFCHLSVVWIAFCIVWYNNKYIYI